MRIAFLTPVYPPMVSGASLAIRHLSEGMAARGHTVLVVTSSDRRVPYQQRESNPAIFRLHSFSNPLRVGQRLVIWPHQEVIRALEEFSPDILYVSDPIQFAIPALKFAHRKRLPSVYLIQQLPWFLTSYLPEVRWLKNLLERILWMYGRWLIHQFDAVVTPSRTIAKIVNSKTGTTPYAISNGVDLGLFRPGPGNPHADLNLRRKLGIPPDVPIILHVGRLDRDKQVDTAIRACAHAMRETNAHLLVVGNGKERGKLQQLCVDMGIQSGTHFTGFITAADGLADIYAMASVFVMASQIETQGIVLLEAAASGIPIVAIDATCIHEIVVHNVNGYLVEPGRIQNMGERLIKLIQNPGCAREMGSSGRKLALRHSLENVLETQENLLLKCHATGAIRNQYKIDNKDVQSESWKY